MTNTNITPAKTVIDPRFDIPEGLDSFVYPDEMTPVGNSTGDGPDSDTVEIFTGEPSDEESDIGDISHDAPPVPMDFIVVSQTIRTSPDGRQLVDVIIQTEDIPGVTHLEFRITK
jgi:hypothetical protein